jgi:hypothetical protein
MAQYTRTTLTFSLLLAVASTTSAHAQDRIDSFATYAAHDLAQNSLLTRDSDIPELPASISTSTPSDDTTAATTSTDPSIVFLPADNADAKLPKLHKPDTNEQFYYRHKLELSLETGALPINTPFVFDVFVGGDYSHNPLHYTLIPIFPAIRFMTGDIKGKGPFRGNTELTAALSLTVVARGPETAYGAFDLGFRRNFIPHNWVVIPYFDAWLGAGFINAAQPRGVPNSQGQDFTFTIRVGTGLRYNINERFGASLGASYMHVSNLYLSEPKYEDYGINVVGPVITVYMRLNKHKKK